VFRFITSADFVIALFLDCVQGVLAFLSFSFTKNSPIRIVVVGLLALGVGLSMVQACRAFDAGRQADNALRGDLDCPPFVELLPFPQLWTWNISNTSKYPAFVSTVYIINDRTGERRSLEGFGEVVITPRSGKSFGQAISHPSDETFTAVLFTRRGTYSKKIRFVHVDKEFSPREITVEQDGRRLLYNANPGFPNAMRNESQCRETEPL